MVNSPRSSVLVLERGMMVIDDKMLNTYECRSTYLYTICAIYRAGLSVLGNIPTYYPSPFIQECSGLATRHVNGVDFRITQGKAI